MGKENIMIDNRGETQSKPVNFINRKIAALTVAGSMILGGVGCAEARTVDTSNNIPTSVEDTIGTSETTKLVTPEVTVTPTPTEAPIETTVPTTVETSAETQYVTTTPTETTINGEILTASEIPGLNIQTKDGKHILVAAANNEYGLKEGEFAGIFISKDLISVEGNPTGGFAINSTIVGILRDKAIAAIPENETLKTKIVLPLDVTKLTKEDGFNIDYAKITSFDINKNYIIVRFNNPIDLVNSSYYGNQFGKCNDLPTLSFNKDGNDFELKNLSLISISTEDNQIENNNDFIFDGSVSTFATYKQFLFGEKLDLTANSFFVIDQVIRGTDSIDIDPSFLLKTESGAIIFIYPNKTN